MAAAASSALALVSVAGSTGMQRPYGPVADQVRDRPLALLGYGMLAPECEQPVGGGSGAPQGEHVRRRVALSRNSMAGRAGVRRPDAVTRPDARGKGCGHRCALSCPR